MEARQVTFQAVDELEQAVAEIGWRVRYRQLDKGDFSARLAYRACGGIEFASIRFDNHLQVQCEPPGGSIGICLPDLSSARATICGQALVDGALLSLPPSSEMEVVTDGEIRVETLFLPDASFRAAARALLPTVELPSPMSAAVYRGDTRQSAAIRSRIQAIHRGHLDPETSWSVLASVLLWMADAEHKGTIERLSERAAASTARRARDYIENEFTGAIRLEDLCRHVGVGLRTLQRCFAAHYQISPKGYIKARRLNEARRQLTAADPAGRSVTGIATACGFTHLGRFSVDYRSHFGETPRQTLASTQFRRDLAEPTGRREVPRPRLPRLAWDSLPCSSGIAMPRRAARR